MPFIVRCANQKGEAQEIVKGRPLAVATALLSPSLADSQVEWPSPASGGASARLDGETKWNVVHKRDATVSERSTGFRYSVDDLLALHAKGRKEQLCAMQCSAGCVKVYDVDTAMSFL